MIRRRFPLKDFPDLTLQQFNLISQIPYPLVSPPPPVSLIHFIYWNQLFIIIKFFSSITFSFNYRLVFYVMSFYHVL